MRHVRTRNPLRATGNQPNRCPEPRRGGGSEHSLRSTEDSVLHPFQRPCRHDTVRVEDREVQDAQRGFSSVASRSVASSCSVSASDSGRPTIRCFSPCASIYRQAVQWFPHRRRSAAR